MDKKRFVYVTIAIALLIFSILPIVNYIADPSRVLHHDYHLRYKKFHQHELVLKTIYVIERKDDFDTLVFGSSRGGFLDMTKISDRAYNMSHGFGTVTTYLHTLKTLLKSGVKVKNVWIGINDFDIWKDHTDELWRLIYYNNILKDMKLYTHWLFRFIPESINIIKEDKPLIETNEVTDQEARLRRSRQQELTVRIMKQRHLHAAKLGYTGIFRIDESIHEVKQIKDLCQRHDINLTVFMYPTYYKTYLFYDQDKIETYKRKLAEVTDFYDFYDIGKIALDQRKWFDESHFVTSVGDYIIDSILANRHLVTKETIEQRIQETRDLLKNMPILTNEDIYQLDKRTNLETSSLKEVFNIHQHKHKVQTNDQLSLSYADKNIIASVDANDPFFTLHHIKIASERSIVFMKIDSPVESVFQIYFKYKASDNYQESQSFKLPLHQGENYYRIVLLSKFINNTLRVDFTRKPGKYTIKEFTIKALKRQNER